MVTVIGWYAGGKGGGRGAGGLSVQSMGEIGEDFCPNVLQPFLEGAVATEAESLLQYFTTLTENADPLLRRWLAP